MGTIKRITVIIAVMAFLVWLLSLGPFFARWHAKAPSSDAFYQQLTIQEQRWLQQHPAIRVGMMNSWPPFGFVDGKGAPQGIGADYISALNQLLDNRLQLVPGGWAELYRQLQQQLDVLLDITPKPERQADFNFTRPYLDIPHVIIAPVDAPYLDSEADLADKILALETGFGNVGYFQNKYPDIEIKQYPDTARALGAVARGEADAYVGNRSVALYIMGHELIATLKPHGRIEKQGSILALAVRKDWPLLASILDKALASLSTETHNRILHKWVPQAASEAFNYQLLLRVLALSALILGLVIYWNMALKRKVRQRTVELEHLALYDPLTELPNRFLAVDRLSQHMQDAGLKQHKVALLFLDLDDFKKINDSVGHQVGDQVLLKAAERLREAASARATLGRLGGDEFILILNYIDHSAQAGFTAERVLSLFLQPFPIEHREVVVTASIGIAIYPEDGKNVDVLLRNAESAMYHAKQNGRNNYCYFSNALNLQAQRRLALEEQMHGALERGEISVYYQPKVDIISNEIIGFEALIRWTNPLLGTVSPAEFIPVAEQNGLILPMGRFVLEQALQTLASLRHRYASCSMAVNVSPRQFQDPSLLEYISTVLHRTGINPRQLELEITEGVLMTSVAKVGAMLKRIQALGLTVAMDDFGTGYSSLSNLRNHPFDTIKIDQEFVRQLEVNESDRNLVKATIAMADSLGLNIVAEGVETEEQRRILQRMGCRVAQGYLFSKPVPASQLDQGMLQSKPVKAG